MTKMAKRRAFVDCKQSLNFLARRSSRERPEPPPTNFCATVALSCEGKERGWGGEGMNGGQGVTISRDNGEGSLTGTGIPSVSRRC